MNRRRMLCWLVFFAVSTAVAVIPEYFFVSEEPIQARKSSTERLTPATPTPAQPGGTGFASSAATQVPQADLFAAHSWRVTPVRPAPVQRQVALQPPPPPPMAPPLPFTFIGKLDDSERLQVFLLRGEAIHVVGIGDVIDSDYQVEHIDATEMTLVYLPLQLTQSLAVGSTR